MGGGKRRVVGKKPPGMRRVAKVRSGQGRLNTTPLGHQSCKHPSADDRAILWMIPGKWSPYFGFDVAYYENSLFSFIGAQY
jgi:hypothetical protein